MTSDEMMLQAIENSMSKFSRGTCIRHGALSCSDPDDMMVVSIPLRVAKAFIYNRAPDCTCGDVRFSRLHFSEACQDQ